MFHRLSIKSENNPILLPAIVFDHVGKFNDEFSFFVLLTALKRMFLEKKTEGEMALATPFQIKSSSARC